MALDETKFKRLRDSINWSNRQLNTPRKKRIEAIKQFVGSHYNDGGAEKRVPTNLLKLAVDIYVRQLAARSPRVMYSTKVLELLPTAENLALAINQIPDEINLTATLRRLVTEALFSMGIAKVGLHSVGKMLGHEYGQPFVDVVTIDDYFCDMSAKHMDAIQYEGNDYWLDYDELMESDWLDKNKRDLKPDEYTIIGEQGEDRAEGVAQSESAQLYREKIWLRDVWLPDEKIVVTYGVKSERILKTVDWDGPACGPYPKLGFSDVPGNLLPLAPVAVWYDLHDLGNALFRKLANQADGQKTVYGFNGASDESVEDLRRAKDGEGIPFTGPPPTAIRVCGIEQTTLAFYLQCRDLYSYFTGNLDSLGGLAPMTETVGQDRLLSEAASAQLRGMADQTVDFTRHIFTSIAWYEWNDPVLSRTIQKPIPGTDLTIPVQFGRAEKIGSFDLYDLHIDVFSMQDDSPGLKLQKLGMVMQQYVMPMAPMIEAAGGTIDVQAILKLVSRYTDLPELAEIVVFTDNPNLNKTQGSQMPADTTRTYERVSRPGATERGKSQILQQALLGGTPQDSEAASLTRPTG